MSAKALRLAPAAAAVDTHGDAAARPAEHYVPSDVADTLRAAWIQGQAAGTRRGYVQGWVWGVVCGAPGMAVAVAGAIAALLAQFAGWL
jgi:hypothetical protein